MNYLSLLKTLFISLSLALYVSIASSQEEVTVTITVTENGEVTIVRNPSGISIELGDITKRDIVALIWMCNGSYRKVEFRYVDGIATVKYYNEKGFETLESRMSFEFYKIYMQSLIEFAIKEQCSRNRSRKEGFCKECDELKLSIRLISFTTIIKENRIHLEWITGTEEDNADSRIWRAIKDDNGDYIDITLLGEFGHSDQVNPEPNENCSTKIQGQLKVGNSNQSPKLVSAIGNSAESICYSFADTSNLGNGTYYYLLEDINNNSESTFHCDQIDAITVGQGPAIDLESAINYCKEITGSNN